jgi:hypothetical protein
MQFGSTQPYSRPMNTETVLLVGLGLVIYAVYRVVASQRKGKAASARYQKMVAICAAHGGVPGPVDLPGVFQLTGALAGLAGLSNQFTNAADLTSREDKRTLLFTLVTARFPGLDMPAVSIRRKGLPGMPIWGQNRIEVESIAFSQRFVVTAQDQRLAFMLLDLPMIQWILDCAEVSFGIMGDGLMASVYRGDSGGALFHPGEPPPVGGDGSELELLYKFVEGFAQRVPALLRTEFAAKAQ